MVKKYGPRWPLTLTATALVLLVLGIGAGLIYMLWRYGPTSSAIFATLAAVPLAAAALLPSILNGRREPNQRLTVSMPDQLDQAQKVLASLVLRQWREEIAIRQLDDPAPLAVRWHLSELPVMDHPDHLTRPMSVRSLLSLGRPRFTGRTDRISTMTAEFRNLARRRLVISGDPGMGKTALAVLLLRDLLQHPRPGEPVPVMVTLSGWDPATQHFHDWLAGRVGDTYPALRAHAFGPDAPRALVTGRRVLPILDGLDELPEPLRPAVITALNATLTDADALVLTCRTNEYQAAINAPGGDVLTAGAVIQPDLLRPADAAEYLTRALPPSPTGAWPAVLAALSKGTTAPLTQALSTPLALWLLRKVYIDTHIDPLPLLSSEDFTTPDQITDHLLDHLTYAVLATNPAHTNGGQERQVPLSRPRHDWKFGDAQRWVSFLAHHLHTTETTEFAWWRLHTALPLRTVRLIITLVAGPAFALAAGLAFGLGLGLTTGLRAGLSYGLAGALSYWLTAWSSDRLRGRTHPHLLNLVVGLTSGPTFGLTFGMAFGPTVGLVAGAMIGFAAVFGWWQSGAGMIPPYPNPSHADLRLHGRARPLMRNLMVGLIVGIVGGTVAEIALGLRDASIGGPLYGLACGLWVWAKSPQASDVTQSPPDSLRRDIQLTGIESLTAGLAFGLATDLVFKVGLAGALAGGLMLGLAVIPLNASGTYLIILGYLSIRRWTPLHLMRFLQDAHRLGLLRQIGVFYQLRHAKLQERLANTHDVRRSPPSTDLLVGRRES